MRTFSKAAWDEAQQLWKDGEFSDEWRSYRHQAAMRGMVYPPEGTKWDGWDDDEPSQRAILIRAIRETPAFLRELIARSSSWSQVVGALIVAHNDHRTSTDEEDRWAKARRLDDEPGPRESTMALKAILTRISDS